MRELASDLPAVVAVETSGRHVGSENAKTQGLMAAREDFGFSPFEKRAADSVPSVGCKNPEIIQPFSTCKDNSDDLCVRKGDPGQMPPLFSDRKRRRRPKPAVHFVHDGLNETTYCAELIRPRSSNLKAGGRRLALVHFLFAFARAASVFLRSRMALARSFPGRARMAWVRLGRRANMGA